MCYACQRIKYQVEIRLDNIKRGLDPSAQKNKVPRPLLERMFPAGRKCNKMLAMEAKAHARVKAIVDKNKK